MTTTEFAFCLSRGLGRAVTFLRAAEDKTPYRQPLIEYLSENRRLLGAYEKALIDCYAGEAWIGEFAEKALADLADGKARNSLPLLETMGYGGRAAEIAEHTYAASYAELIGRTKEGTPTEHTDPCVRRYVNSACAVCYLHRKAPDRIRQIMLDVAEMYRYAEEPVVPVRVSPLYYIWSLLPEETVDALLREAAEVHPYGGKLKPEGYVRSFIPPQPDPDITAAEVIGAEKLTAQLYASFSHAPAPVIREVAQYILDTEYSEAVRDLYALFTPKYPGMTPPEFPLDPTPIIRRLEEKRRIQQADGEDPPLSVLGLTEMYLLASVHHPAVKKLGARLMQAEDRPSRAHGIFMYYGANYEPADRDSLAALLTDMKAEGWATAAHIFIRLLHADTPELPFEQIPFVYAHTDEFLRGELVEALLDTGRMTEEILEECRVDGSSLVHTVLRDHGITGAWGFENFGE